MPEKNSETDVDGVRGYPARVRANTSFGDEPTLMAALKDRAFDPTIFEESPPFFWTAEISNNSVDAYYSRMMPSSLKNYAADAERGISFQNSHNCRELPIGGSLAGRFIGGQGNGAARVEAAFFTIPDLQINQLDTNQFIRSVRSSVVKDVSIGFYGGRSVCSICKNDMWDWLSGACVHWPGETYALHDANGKDTGDTQMAIEQIEDARLAEVSAVYDGATFGAEILKKAVALNERGNLKPETARILESRYRIRLPGKRVIVPGYKEGDPAMPDKDKTEERTMPNLKLREGEAIDFGDNTDLATQVARVLSARQTEIDELKTKSTSTDDERVGSLTAEVERLRPLADAGNTYRADLIEEALSEGVRAQGNAFPKEVQRGMLEKASIEDIKKIRDSLKTVADKTFASGRQTTDTIDALPPVPVQLVPDAAFSA
jgi:hypothetical protein